MSSNFIGVTGVKGELGSNIFNYLREKGIDINLSIELGSSKNAKNLFTPLLDILAIVFSKYLKPM